MQDNFRRCEAARAAPRKEHQMRRFLLGALILAAAPLFAATDTYVIDKSHSAAEFRIKHMMVNVSGKFLDFDGSINVDRGNATASSVGFTIQSGSVYTNAPQRDKHLRSADFFDVDKFPTITFKSTNIVPAKTKDTYNVAGDLTMHGVTRRIMFPVTVLGFMKDPQGQDRAGFELKTTLNRKDYGITWNKALDPGGYLLSDDVEIEINIEAVKK
jgi:polyisoprenoid-binding protein YceI